MYCSLGIGIRYSVIYQFVFELKDSEVQNSDRPQKPSLNCSFFKCQNRLDAGNLSVTIPSKMEHKTSVLDPYVLGPLGYGSVIIFVRTQPPDPFNNKQKSKKNL
jgi:hypothetical protein